MAPASGKFTIARVLLRSVPGRLFDNHAAIDVARTVFDFGAPGFWELGQTVRISVLDAAARENVSLIVTTVVSAELTIFPAFEQSQSVVHRRSGQILPVFLQCSHAEITRRIGNVDRSDRGKITWKRGVRDFHWHKISPVPRSDCLILNTEIGSAEAAAREIIRNFDLATSSGS